MGGCGCAIIRARNRNIVIPYVDSFLSRPTIAQTNLPISVVRKEWVVAQLTGYILHGVAQWFLNCLASGKWSSINHEDVSFTTDYRGLVVLHCVDWT